MAVKSINYITTELIYSYNIYEAIKNAHALIFIIILSKINNKLLIYLIFNYNKSLASSAK